MMISCAGAPTRMMKAAINFTFSSGGSCASNSARAWRSKFSR